WRTFCHSSRFSTPPPCLDSNACSNLRQLFETQMSPKAGRAWPPRYPPLPESLARSPNHLGAQHLLPAALRNEAIFGCPPCGGKTAAPKKSQIFPVAALSFSQTDV